MNAVTVGSVWASDTGNVWKVLAVDGEYVTVENLRTRDGTYRFHQSSLTEVAGVKRLRTMTNAQMNWNLKKGFAWEEKPGQEWNMPIWSKDGGWLWDSTYQLYVLEIV